MQRRNFVWCTARFLWPRRALSFVVTWLKIRAKVPFSLMTSWKGAKRAKSERKPEDIRLQKFVAMENLIVHKWKLVSDSTKSPSRTHSPWSASFQHKKGKNSVKSEKNSGRTCSEEQWQISIQLTRRRDLVWKMLELLKRGSAILVHRTPRTTRATVRPSTAWRNIRKDWRTTPQRQSVKLMTGFVKHWAKSRKTMKKTQTSISQVILASWQSYPGRLHE